MIDPDIVNKMLEYAPAVAVLIWVSWRLDAKLDRFVDACLEWMSKNVEADASRDSDTE